MYKINYVNQILKPRAAFSLQIISHKSIFAGIKSDNTLADKFIYIPMTMHKITTVDHNKWLKRLDTQLNESTNQN